VLGLVPLLPLLQRPEPVLQLQLLHQLAVAAAAAEEQHHQQQH
jgi:hypothetical protein